MVELEYFTRHLEYNHAVPSAYRSPSTSRAVDHVSNPSAIQLWILEGVSRSELFLCMASAQLIGWVLSVYMLIIQDALLQLASTDLIS